LGVFVFSAFFAPPRLFGFFCPCGSNFREICEICVHPLFLGCLVVQIARAARTAFQKIVPNRAKKTKVRKRFDSSFLILHSSLA
jgi:hypothetical protein